MSTRSRINPVRRWSEELEARLLAGETCRAEEYLARNPRLPPLDAVELIYTEFVCREEVGPPPDPAEYFARFPDLRQLLADQFVVHRTLRDGPAPDAPTAGQAVGPYDLVRELGRGSQGAVFAARDRRDGRDVALKLLLSGEYATPDDLALFQHEAAVLARLDHHNLVRILEAGSANGRPYLALELIDGPTLAERVAEFRTPTAAAALVETLARAVHHAHLQGIVHRDIKPGNVLLAADGLPKLTDFGLAKRLDAATGRTRTGHLVGTLGYMAPEQAAGTAHRAGPPADVYALGAVLYELLTGRPPFGPAPSAQTLYRLLNEPPASPRQVARNLPRDLETICLQCLEKNPERRYPTAAAVADDLRRFLDGRPVAARPVGTAVQVARWAGRHPTAAALTGVLALAATVAVAGTAYHNARLTAALTATEESREQAVKSNQGLEAALREADRLQQETKRANAELHTAVGIKESLQAETRRQNDELARRLDDARRALFALQLGQLPALWLREPVRARGLLDDPLTCPPDLRDFTWRYFHRLCRLDERVIQVHEGEVKALAFLPDGRLISAGSDGRLRYSDPWAAAGPSAGLSVAADAKELKGLAVLPGGAGVVTAGTNGVVKIWPIDGTTPTRTITSPRLVTAVAADPAGELLATPCTDGIVRLWRTRTGEPVGTLEGHAGRVDAVAFSPEGKFLATGGADKTVRVWDVAGRRSVAVWTQHAGPVLSVAYKPDGQTIVSTGEGGDVFLWDVRSGAARRLRGHLFNVWAAATAPDGNVIATSGGDRFLKLWDTAADQELTNVMQFMSKCITFSADGRWVAAGGFKGQVAVYRIPAYPPPARYVHPAPVAVLIARPGGGAVTADPDGEVQVWDADGTRPVVRFHGPRGEVPAVALSPDGSTLAVADDRNEIVLWNLGRRAEVGRLTGNTGQVAAVAFRPDGRRVATAGADKTVRVWSLDGPKPLNVLNGHTSEVLAVTYSPDGRTLASAGGDDQTVRLWDADTGAAGPVLTGHTRWVLSLAFSPDGKTLASGSRDRTVRLWNPVRPDEVIVLGGYTNWVYGVSFSPDGRTLATASGHHSLNTPGEVKLCDPRSGYVRAILREFKAPAAFSADGKSLLVGTAGGVTELAAD